MGKTRRKFSAEFKLEAVALAKAGDRSATQVARDLGIASSVIHRWIAKVEKHGDIAFSEPPKPDTSACDELVTAEEVRRLRRELEEARKDREILKKALAYFANEKD